MCDQASKSDKSCTITRKKFTNLPEAIGHTNASKSVATRRDIDLGAYCIYVAICRNRRVHDEIRATNRNYQKNLGRSKRGHEIKKKKKGDGLATRAQSSET